MRDADSRLNWRERHAVDEWIASGYPLHLIRDHPGHIYAWQGGLWGGTKGALKNLLAQIKHVSQNAYNEDQLFLSHTIYPTIKNDQLSHDAYTCTVFANAHSFPTRRYHFEHVGQVFLADESIIIDHCKFFLDDIWSVNPYKPIQFSPEKCRRLPAWTKG